MAYSMWELTCPDKGIAIAEEVEEHISSAQVWLCLTLIKSRDISPL